MEKLLNRSSFTEKRDKLRPRLIDPAALRCVCSESRKLVIFRWLWRQGLHRNRNRKLKLKVKGGGGNHHISPNLILEKHIWYTA